MSASRDEQRNWNDPQYKAWRKGVYQRDRYRCVLCHKYCAGRSEAHHIRTWASCPERRFDVTNGVCLCRPCHKMVHGHEEEYQGVFDLLANPGSVDAAIQILMSRQEGAHEDDQA